jgi:hypothetical protein
MFDDIRIKPFAQFTPSALFVIDISLFIGREQISKILVRKTKIVKMKIDKKHAKQRMDVRRQKTIMDEGRQSSIKEIPRRRFGSKKSGIPPKKFIKDSLDRWDARHTIWVYRAANRDIVHHFQFEQWSFFPHRNLDPSNRDTRSDRPIPW